METWRQPDRLGLIGRALRERAPVVVGDVLAEPDYRPTDETRAVRSEVCIPLWAGGRLWGVLDIEEEESERLRRGRGAPADGRGRPAGRRRCTSRPVRRVGEPATEPDS